MADSRTVGTSNNDSLEGTDGNDVMNLRAGDDVAVAGIGDDLIRGGKGSDTIVGDGAWAGDATPAHSSAFGFASDQTVSIQFDHEGAGYKNSFGVYKIDQEGNIYDVEMVWANASGNGDPQYRDGEGWHVNNGGDLIPGESTYEFDVAAGDSVGFFLIGNGFNRNNFSQMQDGEFAFKNDDGSNATLSSESPDLVFVGSDGSETTLSGHIFHSTGSGENVNMNADGMAHTVEHFNEDGRTFKLGFEDLYGGGDRDYNDIEFTVDIGEENLAFNQGTYKVADGTYNDKIMGGGDGDHLSGNQGNDLIAGGGVGREWKLVDGEWVYKTLDANNGMEAYSGPADTADIIIGGTGTDVLLGQSGDDIIYGDTETVSGYSHDNLTHMIVQEVDNDMALNAQENGLVLDVQLNGSASWDTDGGPSGDSAMDFDGSDGAGASLAAASFGGAMTFSASARFDDVEGGSWQRVFDFGNGSGDDNILLSQSGNSTDMTLHVYDEDGNQHVVTAENVIVEGEWAHWSASVAEDGTMSIYKNGQEVASGEGVVIPEGERSSNLIGDSNWGNDTSLNGSVANLTVHNEALSTNEVESLFLATTEGLAPQGGSWDIINGGTGNDTAYGGYGNDVMNGDEGDDIFRGNHGDDKMNGGEGDDIMRGGFGHDKITGGEGDDLLIGDDFNGGANLIQNGSFEDDNFSGSWGVVDEAAGGWKTGLASFDTTREEFDGNYSDYTVSKSGGTWSVTDGDGNVTTIEGDSTSLVFADSAYSLRGGSPKQIGIEWQKIGNASDGDTRIELDSHGNAAMYQDVEVTDGETYVVTFDFAARTNWGDSNAIKVLWDGEVIGEIANDAAPGDWQSYSFSVQADGDMGRLQFEGDGREDSYGGFLDNVQMHAETDGGNDKLYGGLGNDSLVGGHGNDVLQGNEGEDALSGGVGVDILMGGDGDDMLDGGAGNDKWLDGGAGNDIVKGGQGSDKMSGGTGNDKIWGGHGNDMALGGEGNDWMSGEHGSDKLMGGAGDDEIHGGGGNDAWLSGDAGNDKIYGGSGDDKMGGGTGDDILRGGSGDDKMMGGAGDDKIVGGTGDDKAFGGDGADVMYGNSGSDHLNGNDGDDTIYAGHDDDFVVGGAGNDSLNGGEGSDQLFGRADNDTLNGDAGDDRMFGETGDDTLNGGSGDDFMSGGSGNDVLNGGSGADKMMGGSGSDTLTSGSGDDHMWGGGFRGDSDSDTFVMEKGTGNDTIHDFEAGVDVIDLQALDASNWDDVAAAASEVNGDMVLDLSQLGGDDGDTLTIKDYDMESMSQDDFLF